MKQPDVLAMELDRARAVCESEGLEIELVFSCPPAGAPAGVWRVIRCAQADDRKLLLTVARESCPARMIGEEE